MNRRRFLKQGAIGAGAIGLGQTITTGSFALQPHTLTAKGAQVPNSTSPQRATPVEEVQLHDAVIVSRPGKLPFAEQTAAKVLVEEVEKRTSIRLGLSTAWPEGKPVIAITSGKSVSEWGRRVPARQGAGCRKHARKATGFTSASRTSNPLSG